MSIKASELDELMAAMLRQINILTPSQQTIHELRGIVAAIDARKAELFRRVAWPALKMFRDEIADLCDVFEQLAPSEPTAKGTK